MNATTPCSCNSNASSPLERPRYYPRQLITPADMTLEQNYFRDRLRRHNRLLHGWGVVCGAFVCPVVANTGGFQPWVVSVSPGYILGPYGDEIMIAETKQTNLQVSGSTPATATDQDPWCSPVVVPSATTGIKYIAVKYVETPTRPVQVQPSGCGCSTSPCQASRWRDDFEIDWLTSLPSTYDPKAQPSSLSGVAQGPLPACPSCPADPWVVLAAVTVDAGGAITAIDNCTYRRMVLSFANYWWRCTPPLTITNQSDLQDTTKTKLFANGLDQVFTIQGTNLSATTEVVMGPDITVKKVTATQSTSLTVTVNISRSAATGLRHLFLKNPDCSFVGTPVNIQKPAS